MKNIKLALLLLCSLLSACAGINREILKDNQFEPELAHLTGFNVNDGFLSIDVLSFGCTFKTSFQLELVSKKENSLKVLRTKPDECMMGKRKVSLNYSYRYLGLDHSKPLMVIYQMADEEIAQVN